VIATRAGNPRSASPEEIQRAGTRTGVEITAVPIVADALVRASRLVTQNGIVVITGSIYVVGEALDAIRSSGDRGIG
jgi:dihydrofolate synthase/folylpolyglutamate synthase